MAGGCHSEEDPFQVVSDREDGASLVFISRRAAYILGRRAVTGQVSGIRLKGKSPDLEIIELKFLRAGEEGQ